MRSLVVALAATVCVLDARALAVASPDQLLCARYSHFVLAQIKRVACVDHEPETDYCRLSSNVSLDIEPLKSIAVVPGGTPVGRSRSRSGQHIRVTAPLHKLFDAAYPQPENAYSYDVLQRPAFVDATGMAKLFVNKEAIFAMQIGYLPVANDQLYEAGVWGVGAQSWISDSLRAGNKRLVQGTKPCAVPVER